VPGWQWVAANHSLASAKTPPGGNHSPRVHSDILDFALIRTQNRAGDSAQPRTAWSFCCSRAMNHFFGLSLTGVLVAVGCSHHDANAGNPQSAKKPTEAASNSDAGVVVFSDLPLVDRSEALYRANDVMEIRGTLAFLAESVGIDNGGRFHPLVKKETIIPCEYTFAIAPEKRGQNSIELALHSGSSELLSECKQIGKILIPVVKDQQRTEITITIGRHDAGQILGDVQVSAKDKDSGSQLTVRRIN